ncbi:MAG: ATP-dependent metallopeptidase FtsH/Yme1/Tma family protein [Desulfobacterales bacterium]|nr:ATP-dependent metallopeptidase FtsH/Yme1/Tma family protein [Desulfobacterales bacterium]
MVLILHNMLASMFTVRSIPYSEFLKLVSEQKVAEVAISDNMIQGKLVPDESASARSPMFRTVRVDSDISSLLNNLVPRYFVWEAIFAFVVPNERSRTHQSCPTGLPFAPSFFPPKDPLAADNSSTHVRLNNSMPRR